MRRALRNSRFFPWDQEVSRFSGIRRLEDRYAARIRNAFPLSAGGTTDLLPLYFAVSTPGLSGDKSATGVSTTAPRKSGRIRAARRDGGNTRARPCCTKIHIHRGRQAGRQAGEQAGSI